MAAEGTLKELCEEASCSICLDFFRDRHRVRPQLLPSLPDPQLEGGGGRRAFLSPVQRKSSAQQPQAEPAAGQHGGNSRESRSARGRYEIWESFENPAALPLVLKWHIWDFSSLNTLLEGIKKQFKDTLGFGLHLQKANVTLDPDTAHPRLILSEDQKSVQAGLKTQALPHNPERFDGEYIVLGREGFTGGCHFWEVLVRSEEAWAVGVARKSVRRKGTFILNPDEGIWKAGKWGGSYKVSVTGHGCYRLLTVTGELKRIRVCLNYTGGRVSFFDADRAALLYEFSGASFHGETLLPLFWVRGKGHLKISS
ncbi:E3 ubiquitin-protein ligase TRIM7-like [Heteronotia binoei]|uniref:E3 ubiquitin-protein ligase TRIM7-like n=1 Tax=Heteronotia binoei TaxID=13085 RepID=UPI00293021BA|nr:E3 ubiquitin-protein ligase TRIM7-like [Heteronotia binoei]XP_060094584.1 E3 ubiquitin-protein ligase TRIM7-like [Heteronotia binoei]